MCVSVPVLLEPKQSPDDPHDDERKQLHGRSYDNGGRRRSQTGQDLKCSPKIIIIITIITLSFV